MYDKCYFCLDQLPKLKKESTASFFVNFGGAGVQKSRPTLLYLVSPNRSHSGGLVLCLAYQLWGGVGMGHRLWSVGVGLGHQLRGGQENGDGADCVAQHQDGDSWEVRLDVEIDRKCFLLWVQNNKMCLLLRNLWVQNNKICLLQPMSAVKEVPSLVLRRGKATLPRKPSKEETPMRSPTCKWSPKLGQFTLEQDLVHQGLINAGSLAKADCDAVKAKHGEVKHGEADSSKTESVLGKELESPDCEREIWELIFHFFRNLCV